MPPHYLPGIGIGDFIQEGEDLVRLLRSIGGLRPDDRVLDLGCGLGRVAIPLQRLLADSSYDGLDIVADIIRWNTVNITRVSPNFRFKHLDVRNSTYNPNGSLDPEYVTFPYPNESFSFAFATSLFSHLLEEAARRYLEELARVLRPQGRAIFTFFLLNQQAEERAERGEADIDFPEKWDFGRLNNLTQPEDAVAYDADWLLAQAKDVGLQVRSVEWGRWSGNSDGLSYQDVVVVGKP